MLERKKKINVNLIKSKLNEYLSRRNRFVYIGATGKVNYVQDMSDGYIANIIRKYYDKKINLRFVDEECVDNLKLEMLFRDSKEFKKTD
jgi:hypothetical protein